MLWFAPATRTRPVLIAASLASLLMPPRSPGEAPAAAETQAAAQIAVEIYKAPRPKHLEIPDCHSDSRANDPVACRALNSGNEGWAVVNFMVDPGGKPFEVTVSRSTGNKALDEMARRSIENSRFEPGSLNGKPIESGYEMKYVLWNGRAQLSGAKRGFIAGYEALARAIDAGDRAAADAAMKKLEITNLYEDAYFGMAAYLYAKKWGDERQQLDGLLRAIAEEHTAHLLPSDMFKAALQISLQLQVNMRLYAEALDTFGKLQQAGADANTLARLRPAIDQLEKIRSDDSAYEVPGEMPDGSWNLHLFKRHFQAHVSEGYISQVKLRCQKRYVFFEFDPQLEYQIDSKAGDCSMELIGAPGTRFKLTQF